MIRLPSIPPATISFIAPEQFQHPGLSTGRIEARIVAPGAGAGARVIGE
jgi:hypothetical protein